LRDAGGGDGKDMRTLKWLWGKKKKVSKASRNRRRRLPRELKKEERGTRKNRPSNHEFQGRRGHLKPAKEEKSGGEELAHKKNRRDPTLWRW